LVGLIDQIVHVFFQKPDDMAGHADRRLFHGALSDFSPSGARIRQATWRLTVL
jgi:uncharacterized protein involved in type VI secretion and phage assembly